MRYTIMIATFKNKATAAVFLGHFVRSLPRDIQPVALRKLQILDAATSVDDLRAPPADRLEKLSGNRKGQWSIRVNAQWRICFCFEDGDSRDVEIADYH